MIAGYFTAGGRPCVVGSLNVPRLGFLGTVHFLIDTGSDTTILHPYDGRYLRFPFGALVNPTDVVSVAGTQEYYAENATIVFDDGDATRELDVELLIGKPHPMLDDLDSLLGRDVLNQLGMEYDFLQGQLLLGR